MKMSLVEWMACRKRAKGSAEYRFITRDSETQKLSRPRRSNCRRFKTVMKRVFESMGS